MSFYARPFRAIPAPARLKVGYASELVVLALHSPICPG